MCLASMEPYEATEPRDAIQIAIDGALERHPSLRQIVDGDLDPSSVATGCADTAAVCSDQQAAIAARFIMAAEAIRRQREIILQLEFAARTNADTIERMQRAYRQERTA